jgi:hypothetical protein
MLFYAECRRFGHRQYRNPSQPEIESMAPRRSNSDPVLV